MRLRSIRLTNYNHMRTAINVQFFNCVRIDFTTSRICHCHYRPVPFVFHSGQWQNPLTDAMITKQRERIETTKSSRRRKLCVFILRRSICVRSHCETSRILDIAKSSGSCRDTAITNNDNNMTTHTLRTRHSFRLLALSSLRIFPSESMVAVEKVATPSRNL